MEFTNDPEPWRVELPGIHAERGAHEVAGHSYFDPRPEFDVLGDNPILAEFRLREGNAAEWVAASDWWWRTTATFLNATPEQVEYARQVLEKLAAL